METIQVKQTIPGIKGKEILWRSFIVKNPKKIRFWKDMVSVSDQALTYKTYVRTIRK